MRRSLAIATFVAWVALTAVAAARGADRQVQRVIGHGQIKFNGAGPEMWAARYRREHRLAVALRRELAARLTRVIFLVGAFQCIHQHEGGWGANTGNGYYGGLQFGYREWRRFGGVFAPRADLASPSEQIAAGISYYNLSGFAPWPNTARMCGLR